MQTYSTFLIYLSLYFFTNSMTGHIVPQEGAVRLVGSIEANKGRVEVYHNEEWGTVCDDRWDMNDARVVCRQLGYSGVISVHVGGTYGRGEGPIHFDELNCNGHEERLIDCSHDGVGVHDCYHSEDAGVVCENTPAGQLNYATIYCTSHRFQPYRTSTYDCMMHAGYINGCTVIYT